MKRHGLLLSTLILFALATPAIHATPDDGIVSGATVLADNGPDGLRWDVVLLAEGYTAGQQDLFAADAQAFADMLLDTAPFATHCSAINIWRIDVVSDDEGADDPADCPLGSGAEVATYFDASYCADGATRRLLTIDEGTALAVLGNNVPGWDQAIVLVNGAVSGGTGGSIAAIAPRGEWRRSAIHAIGHSAFGLADEYDYFEGCIVDLDRDVHPEIEPVAANVTTETDPASIKWSELIEEGTPIPTTQNEDCTQCDRQPDPSPEEVVVGWYEGAHYYHCDAARPAYDCYMRNLSPFCPVCQQRILDTLAVFEPDNSAPTCDANGPYIAECEGETTEVTLNGLASSDPDCDELDYAWTGEFLGGDADGVAPTVTYTGLGTSPVDLTVSDGELDDSCDSLVTVEDTTAPELIIVNDIVTEECSSPLGTPVELSDPQVVEVCDPEPVLANDAPVLYPLGPTDVTWTATDASGNEDSQVQVVNVEDTTSPDLTAPADVTAECGSPDGTPVELGQPTVSDICDAEPLVTNDAPELFPLGQTVVTWTATDASENESTAEQIVTVVDTTPPELALAVTPDELWPPNHTMIDITVTAVFSDICDADPELRLVSITSNQPPNGNGDGNTEPDILGAELGTHDLEFQLRAERQGGGPDGRVYTIDYTVEDDSGNSTPRETEVTVAHDQRPEGD